MSKEEELRHIQTELSKLHQQIRACKQSMHLLAVRRILLKGATEIDEEEWLKLEQISHAEKKWDTIAAMAGHPHRYFKILKRYHIEQLPSGEYKWTPISR